MSRTRSIYLVARREILERGRSRAFLISLALTVVFLAAGIFLPTLIGGSDAQNLGVVGTPPAGFEEGLQAAATQTDTTVTIEPIPDIATGEAKLSDGSLDALLVIPAGGGDPEYVIKEGDPGTLGQLVSAVYTNVRTLEVLTEAGVDLGQVQAAQQPPTIRSLEPSDPTRDTAFIFANVGVILLFIAIFTFGTWVLTGVVEEKQSRVVEVVLSTVVPRDLLIGKVLGIGLLGLVQLVIIVVIGLSLGTITGRFALPATTGSAVAMLLLWFAIGYVFYSTALAVLGALASRMEEASNASSPVSILASLSYVFALLVAVQDPDGIAARIATFVPPVSPMIVPLRAALGAIEPWEIGLAIIVNLIVIALLLEFGGRVYSGAVLQTAGRMKLRDAWRASNQ
ncbi:MAG TPA: ABC transporter permease [Candidatus Limnocylindrales bacterium]|nr:ABC transporter permease [Candidatus Limnocylindrales bacterium]